MNPHARQSAELFDKHFDGKQFSGIEIGTAEGEWSSSILDAFPNLTRIYTIDPYVYNISGVYEAANHGQWWHDDRKRKARELFNAYPVRAVHLCMTSIDAVKETPDEVDFVWIDGDHRDFAIIADIENYYPKVKSGGIFGGHDSDKAIHLVKARITEEIIEGVDLTWWAIKK